MNDTIDIDVILDEKYIKPHVTIHTKTKSSEVETIIHAIENASERNYPFIKAHSDKRYVLVSQRNIIRIRTEGREVIVETEDGAFYFVKDTLKNIETILDSERFVRISQSEIVNLYKVKDFDINFSGTIGIEFDNGLKTWVSRRYVKTVKAVLYNQ